ncbi:leukocyte elastase inhibitor-like isoform X2 [Planococcus citri]|uniref:leukocyte elastase inhibitor-like isoform X2 n=1 Tax=Planococcus citri TaxID=170843 RepID=UPI0031F89F78
MSRFWIIFCGVLTLTQDAYSISIKMHYCTQSEQHCVLPSECPNSTSLITSKQAELCGFHDEINENQRICCNYSTNIVKTKKSELVVTSESTLVHNVPFHKEAQTEERTVQDGLLSFGIKLNSILLENNGENKNILFSPYNLYTQLALVHLGSNGITRDTISNVLNIPVTFSPKSLQEILQNFSSVLQINPNKTYLSGVTLHNGSPVAIRPTVKASDLKLANGIFVQNEYRGKLKKNYVEDVQLYQQSDIFNVDFTNKGEAAKDTINKYISNKTENRIPRLLEHPLAKDTLVVLTSSLYFKSAWRTKFNRDQTKAETFRTDKGNVTVQMMHALLIETGYAEVPSLGVRVVQLRYIDDAFSMFIGLPDENQSLQKVLRKLTSDQIRTIIDEAARHIGYEIDLKLPKTAFKWSQSVKNYLIELGLAEEIWESPDLSNMMDQSNMTISDIGHGTDITINEEGTEASAASMLIFGPLSGKITQTFHVNRPFFFFIYNHNIHTIIFFGTVFDPNSAK